MDVLALTSVAVASSNLVYCQLSVASALGELLSSKFVNFSNGTNVLVDFYSDPNDNNGTTTGINSNNGELFTVSISNCIDYDVGIKSTYQDYVSLEASPSSILYEASFHDLYHLLSDSSLPSLNLSSTPISLFRPEYPTFVRSAKESSIEARQRHEKLEPVDSTELLVHLESYPAYQGDVQIIAVPTIILWTAFTTYLDSALQEAVASCSSPQSVIYVLYHILILIVLYWVNHYLKILSVASSEFHATPPATPTGHESLMCIAKNLNLLLLMSEEDININLKRSESEEQARGKKLKVSVEEEYYNMIESASEVVSGDHTTWDCDSEAESDSSIDNDSPAKRDGSEVLFSTFLRYEPHRSIVDISNCSTLSPLSPSSNLTGEVANSEWCNNFKLEEIREKRKKEAIRPTVDSVELAFLAGECFHISICFNT